MRRRLGFALATSALALVAAAPCAWAQIASGGAGGAPATAGGGGGALNTNVAPMTTGTAAVSGVVLDEATRQPIAGAVVYLGPPSRGPQGEPVRQIADAKGRFLFTQLPAWDSYFLQASKFGYFEGSAGRGGSGSLGARTRVVDGQWLRDQEILLRRYGSISGVVTDEHNDPIVNGYVRVLMQVPVAGTLQLAAGHVEMTDDRGRYRISALMPGKYIVQVPIVQSTLPASISMRTLAGLGPPNPNIPEPATPPMPKDPIVDIDDQTLFVAGRYPTPPRSADGRAAVYPITFYPSAPALDAAVPITLNAGEDRVGIDIRVTSVAASRISGVLDGPAEAIAGLVVRLLPPGFESMPEGSEAATAMVGERGEFTFVNVPNGAYTIDARRVFGGYQNTRTIGAARSLPAIPAQVMTGMGTFGVFSGIEGTQYTYKTGNGDSAYSGRQPIVVDGRDIAGVKVPMRRGVTISGRLVFEGDRSSIPPISFLALQPARGDASLGVIRATINRDSPDVFSLFGVLAGEYLFSSTATRIKSVICRDKDYTYTPIDTTSGADVNDCVVTFTDKTITVTGTVRDDRAAGNGSVDAAVIVFPVEREQWTAYTFSPVRLKSINTTSTGTYRFTSLPEGDYYFIAASPELMTAWQTPAFLERALAQATRVALRWGDTATQNLTMKVVK